MSGYTVAIVGIPGALDAGNAFYIATGRVTEVCLGIIAAATVNRIVLPSLLGPQLWQAVAGARETLADYAIALFRPGDSAPLRAKLLGQAIAIENLRASAIFEDREIRDRSDRLRFLDWALIDVVGVAQLLGPQLDARAKRRVDRGGSTPPSPTRLLRSRPGVPPRSVRPPFADVCCGRRHICLAFGRCRAIRQRQTRR